MTDQAAQFSAYLLNRHFIGEAFRDELFNTDNNRREKACAWKIQSSQPLFSPLTDQSWYWRAVGIPLNLIDKSLEGDIDLMFSVWGKPMGRDVGGRLVFPEPMYRCFELKTSKVSRSGEVKSLKEGKFHKTRAQLEKLCAIGAPQVFLLEAFVVEAGYTGNLRRAMPDRVRESVAHKYDQIARADFGYLALGVEQIQGFSEADTAIHWPVATIKGAKSRAVRAPFSDLISAVESYVKKAGAKGYSPVVTFCDVCRGLTWAPHRGPYLCRECKAPLV